MRALVVGISGKKRHGKDTLCQAIKTALLDSKITVVRHAFADELKKEVAQFLAPVMNNDWQKIYSEMYDDNVKERYRLILQWWGTELRRKENQNYWVECMGKWVENQNFIPPTLLVIPDVRFNNEAEFVKSHGGVMVRINRPCLPIDKDSHDSENELNAYDQFDCNITAENLDELQKAAVALSASFKSLVGCRE